jgi:uncharacterized protein (DUF433 family)
MPQLNHGNIAMPYGDVYTMVMDAETIDWTGCPNVEMVPGRMNGQPVVKGTRMPADGVVENFETGSPIAEIAENFGLEENVIRTILAYAESHKPVQFVR